MTSFQMILERVRQVRRHWRIQRLIRGIAICLAATIALLVLGVWGADLFGFNPAAVWCMRILTAGLFLFSAWYFLYMPLRTRVSDITIAQYIEEKYPKLEDRLVAAVEYGDRRISDDGMIQLLIRDALQQTTRVDFSVFLHRKRLAAFGLLGFAAVCALLALLAWGPSFLFYGLGNIYAPWMDTSGYNPRMITVLPGDVDIARGSDQLIDAALVGFDSPDVRLYRRSGKSGSWSSTAMRPDPRGGTFRYLLVDVRDSQQYYVESKGVRSQIHNLNVVEQARVDRLDLTYNFPAYTGMSPQTVENEGDIAALKGTRMDLKVRLNIPVQSARLLFDDGAGLDLSAAGNDEFGGSFVLERSGYYTVQVTESRGDGHAASREYDIEVIEDEVPRVTVTRPMRDVRATRVEEVFTEIKAEDDIAVDKVELRYSVNGAPEKSVDLYGGNPPDSSVTAAYTFFLEDFGLQPGDLISYYASARDGNSTTGPAISSSDIYFIQVRPFQQNYKQSQQQAMPGSGSEGEGGEGNGGQQALSRQQKEIISATFKLIRDKERMESKEYLDGLQALSTIQSRLQSQAQGLVDRLRRREAAEAGMDFQMLGEHLKNAVGEMEKAALDLGRQRPDSALPQEQKSLQQLMRAESLFREIQVSFASSARNAGGRGSQASAQENLADLFELELNKLKNQYETVQREEQQERDQKVDEALERLRELAQRQQQLNERNRMQMQQGGSPPNSRSGSSGQRQQQLLDQAEQLRRQLQRLSRERSSPRLDEASNRIREAIEEMRQTLNNPENGSGSEQGAQGERALQQLNEAVNGLARSQEATVREELERAVKESGDLVKQQEKIQEELERLAREMKRSESSGKTGERSEGLVSRKNTLADSLDNLENLLRNLSRQARRNDDRATGNRIADTADTIRDRRLADRIQQENMLIQNGFLEGQQLREEFVREDLEEIQKQLEATRSRLGESEQNRIEEAASRARQLAEGLESMQRRLGEMRRGQGNRPDQQAQGQGTRQDPSGQRAQNNRGMQGTGARDPRGGRLNPNADEGEFRDDTFNPLTGFGGIADGLRQFTRELDERLKDAEYLRRMMNRNPTLVENLEKVINALKKSRDLPDSGTGGQAALLNEASEYMQVVEYDLARDLQRLKQMEEYFIAGENEIPEGYRKLVEEYYKSIAKEK